MGLYNRDYMRDPDDPLHAGWVRRSWSAVGLVAAACVLVFAWQLFQTWRGALPDLVTPGEVSWEQLLQGEWWRLLSYNFVHGGPFHLLLNLAALFVFGRLAWHEFGNRHWLAIFLLGGVLGGLAYVCVFRDTRLVGASAGFYALMAAVTVRMPDLPLSLPFLPGLSLRLRNITLGFVIFDVICVFAQLLGARAAEANVFTSTQIASLSHLGGALAGFLYVRVVTDGFNSMVRESERRELAWRQERLRRREPTRVAAGRASAAEDPAPEAPPADFMEDKVNPILEKLHAHGRASLNAEEQRILDEAARRLRGKS